MKASLARKAYACILGWILLTAGNAADFARAGAGRAASTAPRSAVYFRAGGAGAARGGVIALRPIKFTRECGHERCRTVALRFDARSAETSRRVRSRCPESLRVIPSRFSSPKSSSGFPWTRQSASRGRRAYCRVRDNRRAISFRSRTAGGSATRPGIATTRGTPSPTIICTCPGGGSIRSASTFTREIIPSSASTRF